MVASATEIGRILATTNAASQVIPVGTAVSAGEVAAVFASVQINTGAAPTLTCTDSKGNTWTQVDQSNQITTATFSACAVWVCTLASGKNLTTSDTITLGTSVALGLGAVAYKVSGVDTATPVRTSNKVAVSAPATAILTGSVTPAAGDLVLGLVSITNTGITVATPTPAGSAFIANNYWTSPGAKGLAVISYSAPDATAVNPGCTASSSMRHASMTVAFKVGSGNVSPTASAGATQANLTPGTTVTLDSSASTDPDGTIVSRAWTHRSGPTLLTALSSTTAVAPTYTAPGPGVTDVWRVTVLDNGGASSSADVAVSTAAAVQFTGADGSALPAAFVPGTSGLGSRADIRSNAMDLHTVGGTGYDPAYAVSRRLTLQYRDFESTFQNWIPDTGVELYTALRYRGTDPALLSNCYYAELNTSSGVLHFYKHMTGGATPGYTQLGPTVSGFSTVAGTHYFRRVRVQGTIHKIKVWTGSSGAEPFTGGPDNDGFQLKVDDATFSSVGYLGFSSEIGSAAGTRDLFVDDFSVTSLSNVVPVASAGASQTVPAWLPVTLDSSASYDPDGSIVSRVWSHLSGTLTVAALSSTTAVSPSYSAPGTIAGTTDVWRVSVTDDQGGVSTADVSVVVQPCNERAVVGGVEVPLRMVAA